MSVRLVHVGVVSVMVFVLGMDAHSLARGVVRVQLAAKNRSWLDHLGAGLLLVSF